MKSHSMHFVELHILKTEPPIRNLQAVLSIYTCIHFHKMNVEPFISSSRPEPEILEGLQKIISSSL